MEKIQYNNKIQKSPVRFEKYSQPVVFTVGNYKGGVGKTTFAVNLASTISMYGYKVLLLGLDPQNNVLQWVNKNKNTRLEDVFKIAESNNCNDSLSLFNSLEIPKHNHFVPDVYEEEFKSKYEAEFNILSMGDTKETLHIYEKLKEKFHKLPIAKKLIENKYLLNFIFHQFGNIGYQVIILDTPPQPSFMMNEDIIINSDVVIPITTLNHNGISGLKDYVTKFQLYTHKATHDVKMPLFVINDIQNYSKTTYEGKSKDNIKSVASEVGVEHLLMLKYTTQFRKNEEEKQTIWGRIVGSRSYRQQFIELFEFLTSLDVSKGRF